MLELAGVGNDDESVVGLAVMHWNDYAGDYADDARESDHLCH